MKKSKRASKIIISILLGTAALSLFAVLLVLHLAFPFKYNDAISSASKKYEIDADLIRGVIWTESRFKKDAVSNKGAVGLMQLLPETAEYAAKLAGFTDFSEDMLYDEATNIDIGACYLRYLFDRFDGEETVLAAYNAGEGNVRQWQKEGITDIPFKETKDYVKRVAFVKKVYEFKSK